ncbi:MAG: threonine ammonia-lyase [Microscillaceae bacterium]
MNTSNTLSQTVLPSVTDVLKAYQTLKKVVNRTPLQHNLNYSEQYQAFIYFKREDLQVVRSYKLRGAYYKISTLPEAQRQGGIVCASAGNHAQGVAYACRKLGIQGTIFMPIPTPGQKVKQTKMFGREFIEVILKGDTFDEAYEAAKLYEKENKRVFIHPFNDEKVIIGQGTVGLEMLEDCPQEIDYVFMPVGGGGLSSGVGSYLKQINPKVKIIGVEPAGAPAMQQSLRAGKIIALEEIDKFVDGAAVAQVGDLNFSIAQKVLDQVVTVAEGKVCSTILKLYNEEAIVVEPAGALSIAALDDFREEIRGKTVVCVVSGGNNDITRMEEIKERALLHQGLKHYFIIRFPQRPGALKEFVMEVLGPTDDIAHFEYTKKNNREKGPALLGIEVQSPEDYQSLLRKMDEHKIVYEALSQRSDLFKILV